MKFKILKNTEKIYDWIFKYILKKKINNKNLIIGISDNLQIIKLKNIIKNKMNYRIFNNLPNNVITIGTTTTNEIIVIVSGFVYSKFIKKIITPTSNLYNKNITIIIEYKR